MFPCKKRKRKEDGNKLKKRSKLDYHLHATSTRLGKERLMHWKMPVQNYVCNWHSGRQDRYGLLFPSKTQKGLFTATLVAAPRKTGASCSTHINCAHRKISRDMKKRTKITILAKQHRRTCLLAVASSLSNIRHQCTELKGFVHVKELPIEVGTTNTNTSNAMIT